MPQPPMSGFQGTQELVIEPVYGVRQFTLDGFGRLRSLHFFSLWWENGINIKTCRREEYPNEEGYCCSGLSTCSCGFYAYHSHRHLIQASRYMGYVSGIIEGTGEIIIGTRGFRAEKARVVALTVDNDYQIQRLKLNYPEVALFKFRADMISQFRPTYLDAFPEEEYPNSYDVTQRNVMPMEEKE